MNRTWLRSRLFLLGRTEFSQAVFGRIVSANLTELSSGCQNVGVPKPLDSKSIPCVSPYFSSSGLDSPPDGSATLRTVPIPTIGLNTTPVVTCPSDNSNQGPDSPVTSSANLSAPPVCGQVDSSDQPVGSASNIQRIHSCNDQLCSNTGDTPEKADQQLHVTDWSCHLPLLLPPIELIVPLSVSPAGSASLRYRFVMSYCQSWARDKTAATT